MNELPQKLLNATAILFKALKGALWLLHDTDLLEDGFSYPKLVSHLFIESLRLEKTSKVTQSGCLLIPTTSTSHFSHGHISTVLEHLQKW